MTNLGINGVGTGTEIGRGGHAVVFSATQLDLDRPVAVKMLQLGHDDDMRRRFDRERRLMARLQHPNIAPVLDSGYSSKGEPYLVMPLYGQALDSLGALPWPQVVTIMLEVANAVAYAHSHHVLHRDLKPANIMLGPDGPVVLDFGIATAIGSLDTRSIGLRLTVGFAPPEAFDEHDPGQLLDVYGLGATTHALLSGQAPFSTEGSNLWHVIERIGSEPPADLRQIAPARVCDAIERAMAKRPEDRQSSAQAFAQELERATSSHAQTRKAPPIEHIEPATIASPQRRTRTMVASAVFLTLVAFAGLFGLQRWQSSRVVPVEPVPVNVAAGGGSNIDEESDASGPTIEPSPTSRAEPTAVGSIQPEASTADPTPDAQDLMAAGVAEAMRYVGVGGQEPELAVDCPGLFGWCLGDQLTEVQSALGQKPGNQNAWVLPGGDTFSVVADDAGFLVQLGVAGAPGSLVALPGEPPLGRLDSSYLVNAFGSAILDDTFGGFDTETVVRCADVEQQLQFRYTFNSESSRFGDGIVDQFHIYIQSPDPQFVRTVC